MKKRVLGIALALIMVLSLAPAMAPVRAEFKPQATTSDYFFNQLNDRAKEIYTKLLTEFGGESTRALYYTGTKDIDLTELSTITPNDIQEYLRGNKDIFNDFCAAKDALDLDHSELWYIDSGYLSFRVTSENGSYHVIVGPGRGKTYLLGGQEMEDVASMDETVNSTIDGIVDKAFAALNANSNSASFTEQDRISYLVGHIHDQITNGIHYRYEIECKDDGANAKYIRTIYGIVTHEGVCEAYSRTLQVALRRAGIQCVLIHGVQTKGTPEDHMWNAVNIPDAGEHWYVVDATWDDPLVANYDGTRDLTFHNGVDGRETNTYLMVGQAQVGEYWRPSGYVSTGNFEFKYPTIETYAYSGAKLEGDFNGIEVNYSSGASMEDNTPAGVFTVTYNGMNAAKAREKKLYFMFKMYDYHPDGTADVMDEWYYADASFFLSSDNKYFGDTAQGIRIYSATCEYIDIAVTSREPDHRSQWSTDPYSSYLSQHPEAGYFHGDETEIVAQTGMLYNVNAGYEAPPYVLTQTPAPNGNVTAGYEYRYKVTFDDLLYHVLPTDENARNGIASVDAYDSNYDQAKNQTVQLRYITEQEDLHNNNAVVTHQVVGDLPFDKNRDGIVDMDGSYTGFKWIYANDTVENGGRGITCPNEAYHVNHDECDVYEGCPIVGVEFNFRASDQWIDDVTRYTFILDGLVGSRSSKFPNNFSSIAVVPGLCPACYRSQGIDWNLWGQPTLLDAPENLDLHKLAEAGGTDSQTLAELDAQMNRDDINGRLMLVVEDKSKGAGNREEFEKINEQMEKKAGINDADVISSSVFEINFNRLCPMVKLKPNKGESLRVQVGYPAGVTYDTLGDVELKAYHFTRCDANNKCPNYDEPGHKDGDHILSVEEIQIIPTPYGMVIMCNAFSPFEIVAVRKTGGISTVANEPSTVVVVSDGNGVVSVDGHDAVGEYGNMKFPTGAVKTFTVKPDPGYVVDTVSLGGEKINVEGDTFTVSGVDHSDVLSVTFVPTSVHEADVISGRTTVVAKVCTHSSTRTVSDSIGAKDPTCTEAGHALAVVCNECGQTVTPAHDIPATGHTVVIDTPEKPATCTASGTRAVTHCSKCSEQLSKGEVIPALGHIFTDYKESAHDCRGLSKTATCDREGCNVTETVTDPTKALDHKYTNYRVVTPATCATEAVEEALCDYGCGTKSTRDKTGSKLPHTPDSTGKCTKCGEFLCASGHTFVTTAAVDATCTENGHTAGEKCSVCGYWKTPEQLILPKGHTFPTGHAGDRCTVCGQVMSSDTHTPVEIPDLAPTCDTQGTTGGTKCSVCGDIITSPTVVPALGHDWDTSSPEWTWSTEGKLSASVTLTCRRDSGHRETFSAELTEVRVTKEPTCKDTGAAIYTASFIIDGVTLSDTNNNVPLPTVAHTPGTNAVTTTEATCSHHGTRSYKCSVCGEDVVETVEGQLKPHTFAPQHIAPTCTEAGYNANVCTVCGYVEKIAGTEVPAAGHKFSNGKCTVCGALQSNAGYVPPSGPIDTPAKPAGPTVFPDVAQDAWYADAVAVVSERGLILGDQNGSFNPEMSTGRGQLMTILARLSGVDTTGSDPWYKAGMDWAVANNISDGTAPLEDLPREQFVTMLYRFMKEPAVSGDLSAYPDAGKVDDWARDAMIWAVENGLVEGTDQGLLEPSIVANRAVAATILVRFLDKFDL